MSLLVDTSVCSLAFRRSTEVAAPEVQTLQHALDGSDQVFTTGRVLQELLQGFNGPKTRGQLIDRFAALGFIQPDREDHIEATEVRNACRRHGIQIGTIAVLIQLCLKHDLVLLSSDKDFRSAVRHVKFRLWRLIRGACRKVICDHAQGSFVSRAQSPSSFSRASCDLS